MIKREICIEAINLKSNKLNGYRLLTVYSKELGILRLSGSRLGGRSEAFVRNNFWINYNEKSEIHSIKQSEFIGHCKGISQNYEKLINAWQWAEFLEACSHTGEDNSQELFDLFWTCLEKAEEMSVEVYEQRALILNLYFLWNLSHFLGYEPNLHLCQQNHEKSNCPLLKNEAKFHDLFFDFEQGGILCSACPSDLVMSTYSSKILGGIYKIFTELQNQNLKEILTKNLEINYQKPALEFAKKTLQKYLQVHAHHKLKSIGLK